MKPILILTAAALLLVGCTSQPVAMKSNTKYFAPATKTTKTAAAPGGFSKVNSVTAAQKKINEKDTQIELLRKENKELRERIQRLEKKLQIQNS